MNVVMDMLHYGAKLLHSRCDKLSGFVCIGIIYVWIDISVFLWDQDGGVH